MTRAGSCDVRVTPLLRPWSAGLRKPQPRSPRGRPHDHRAGLTESCGLPRVGASFGKSRAPQVSNCILEAENVDAECSKLERRKCQTISSRALDSDVTLTKRDAHPSSSTPSNTMPHSGVNHQVRFSRLLPPYHRVASSFVPRAFHKSIAFDLTSKFNSCAPGQLLLDAGRQQLPRRERLQLPE